MKASTKDILREIKKSGMRFFYISSIIALGVAFFCGIKATSPSMIQTAYNYFSQNNLSDFRLVSTYGIREEDITRLSEIDGVEDVSGGYSTDQVFEIGDSKSVLKILSLPQVDGQNTPVLREGRFPLNNNECVLEYDNSNLHGTGIGDKLTIINEDNSDIPLHSTEFEVVGFIETPQYISLEHGNTNIGSGTIDGYLMVNPQAFDIERFTEAYIYTDISKDNITPYSDEYSKAQDEMISTLEDVGDEILEDNLYDIRMDALKEIGKGQQEYDSNKQKFDKEIADAQKQLDDGQTQLDDGFRQYYEGLETFNTEIANAQRELDSAQTEIDQGFQAYQLGQSEMQRLLTEGQNQLLSGRNQLFTGYQSYNYGLNEFNTQMALAEEELDNARVELEEGYRQYQAGLDEFNTTIANAQAELDQALEEYNIGYKQFKEQEDYYNSQIDSAQEELDKGWEEYNTGLTEFNKNKEEFEKQIQEAQAEIDSNQQALDNQETELNNQIDQYNQELERYEQAVSQFPNPDEIPEELKQLKEQLDQTKIVLDQAKTQLEQAREQLNNAQTELDAQREAGQEQLDTAQKQLEDSYNQLNAAQTELNTQKDKLEAELAPVRKQLEEAKAQIDSGQEQLDIAKQQGQEELNTALGTLQAGQAALESGIKELESNRISASGQLESSLKMLQNAEVQLIAGEEALRTQSAAGQAQLNDAYNQLVSGQEQLEQGKVQFNEQRLTGQTQLRDSYNLLLDNQNVLISGRQEFETQKADGERQLNEAKTKLDDARKQVNDLNKGEWYVYSRGDNPGYTSYQEDSERIDKIGNVFPLFFFLVAALVAFSTMTRMVEEERSQIGTLYALGFSKWQIVKKFVIYAGTASLIGSIVGAILGIGILPNMIFTAYNILYNMPELELTIPWDIVIISFIVAMVCTVGAATIIALVELRNVPAELMRPKAPKPGKRILLERIPFIWNRLNFISKVSARNIFRYKARFLMTVFGIAGCTALILAGFGLHDAIFTIIPNQFGTIFKYDESLILSESKLDLSKEVADVLKDERVSAALASDQQSVDVKTPDGSSLSATLIIPEDVSEFPTFISLHDRLNREEEISLPDDGVVVSEKLATNYGAQPGSTIKITINNKPVEAKVAAQTENYLRSFVYMSPAYYQSLMGEAPSYSTIFINFSEKAQDQKDQEAFAEDMIESDTYASAVNTSTIVDSSEKMLNSLNIIVIVMIVSAGMLAFIVLNNLTNINISERMREIATLKVLGFRSRETNNYIFRENIILSIIGIIVGLFLGVLLLRYIIYTVELDIIMFGREIFTASYIYAILLTLGFTIIVNFTMIPIINRVNMVESLKDID